MAECCECPSYLEDKVTRNNIYYRNLQAATVAFLLHIPQVESYFFSSTLLSTSFILLTIWIGYIVYKDFNHLFNSKSWFYTSSIIIYSLLLTHLLLSKQSIELILITFIPAVIVAIKKITTKFTKKSSRNDKFSFMYNLQSLIKIPSMDSIILFSSFLSWIISTEIVLNPLLDIGEIMLQESLLTLSIYNLCRCIRLGWEQHKTKHNSDAKVTVKRKNESRYIALKELCKDDIIVLKKEYEKSGIKIPVGITTFNPNNLKYQDSANERICTTISQNTLNRGSTVYTGEYECTEGYKEIEREKENNKVMAEEQTDLGVRILLSILWASAILLSSYTMFTLGIIEGFKTLSLSMMVCCPCVYTMIKPALQNEIKSFLENNNLFIKGSGMPLLTTEKIIVIDRTGTLFLREENKEDYIIPEEYKNMLTQLLSKGYKVKILSGHGTSHKKTKEENNMCTKHLNNTIQMLINLGMGDKEAKESVVFSSDCHGQDSKKDAYIKNLKRYGLFTADHSQPIIEQIKKFISGVFFPRTIIMVGDDINDKKAFDRADISILAASSLNNFDENAGSFANFIAARESGTNRGKDGVANIHTLINCMDNVSRWAKIIMGVSFTFSALQLAAISGIVHLPFVVSPSLICSLSTSYCIFITVFTNSGLLKRNLISSGIKSPVILNIKSRIATLINLNIFNTLFKKLNFFNILSRLCKQRSYNILDSEAKFIGRCKKKCCTNKKIIDTSDINTENKDEKENEDSFVCMCSSC